MCCRILIVLSCVLVLLTGKNQGEAQSRSFRMSVPDTLVASGFLKHLLPRFSLKNSIRIELVAVGSEAEVHLSTENIGRPVFSGLGETWFLEAQVSDNDLVARFTDWLSSDVGRRTIETFKAESGAIFVAAVAEVEDTGPIEVTGDIVQGEKLAVIHCGRCHMVNEATRLSTIGSSPSFAVMRSFADWQARFEAFFALNPHPSFTIIDGVTEPFDEARPPPMVPVELSLTDLEAILAFVTQIPPADLGAPIQYQ
ncbi:hypothetical protein K1718_06295 [Roseibium porphyridii]|uniref:Cytochrome c domain-containing protein n=1 Tax=Roseibium porphyridii TaxID=2866279 RepID=A0ABY8F645_9HYPH|nr:hypothetical protein [Roseibium sp. KMA01]WFE90956.1 hypothetical protein K1718_06295 [Roseibium sp. KMA01]